MSRTSMLITGAMHPRPRRISLQNEAPRARAVRAIRALIADGQLAIGEPLPPERQLSKMVGVGMTTLQRALRVIEAEGSIQSISGKTRIVTGPESSIANAIVLVGSVGHQPTHLQPGWADFTPLGVMQGLRQTGNAFVCLSCEEALKRFAASTPKPKAVIVIQEAKLWGQLRERLLEMQEQQIPIALFNDLDEPSEFDNVSSDHFAGAYQLTQWLIARGCRRILNFWPDQPMVGWMQHRYAGYKAAMIEAGLEPLALQSYGSTPQHPISVQDFELESRMVAGHLGPILVSKDAPNAIMCVSDGHVPKIARAASFFHRKANVDLALVGYDCYWMEAPERQWEHARPLATVDKQNFLVGLELAKILCARISRELVGPVEHRKIAPNLVILPEDAELNAPLP